MKRCQLLASCLCVLTLTACQHPSQTERVVVREAVPASTDTGTQVITEPALEPPPSIDSPTPPCFPLDSKPRPNPKRRVKTANLPPLSAPEPAVSAPTPGEPSVKSVTGMSLAVLGKKVRGEKGEDFGRVVDVLADMQGRVRLAIIETGGFLGVGNRRIATDWSLLKFDQDASLGVLTLGVTAHEFQNAPEYKDNGHPLALMAPPDTPTAVKQ